MGVSCASCKSLDLRKLKRNSFLKEPGYVCNSCGLKMRGVDTKDTLYMYIGLGLLFAVVGFFSGWDGLIIGLIASAYGAFKLREPEPGIGQDS